MADHFLSRSGGGRTGVLSNEDGIFQLRGKACTQLVEIPDIHFHLNSPMVFLDPDGALIHGLCQAFFVAEDHPDRKVVVAGHADTSGDIRPNYALSLQRAKCIQAILVGDQAQWNEVAAKAKVEDLQRTLKSIADLYYWHCDPGEVDGRMGPTTRKAVEGFQHEANTLLGLGLEHDGIMGPQSWGALLQVFRFLLQRSGANLDVAWNFVDSGDDGAYACGESFPIEQAGRDNFRSQKNRRVEIYFGAAEDLSPLDPPPSLDELLTSEQCVLYDSNTCSIDPVSSKSSVSVFRNSPEGDPMPGVALRLVDGDGNPVGEVGTTNAKGWAHWMGLEPGEYEVQLA
jgi:outer membrane protein OmpA-like peptidoglycan-associated protein